MDYSKYEDYGFERVSAFNLSTGYEQRSYQEHWHSFGEILLVGPGKTNTFTVNRATYDLAEGDFLLIWPMEMHAIMAEMAGISKDYFSRTFRSVTGMNYSKWLNMIRLEKATELLADREKTLTEVAMLSGFQSISSFNRVFRAEKGMAPGEYRTLRI